MSTTLNTQQSPVEYHARRTVEVISLPARFDAYAAVDFDSIPDGASVVVDGRAVRFADMHALQSLVDARIRLLDAGGDMLIGAPSVELRATLELTGFDQLLSVVLGGAR